MKLTSLLTWARHFGVGRHVELACVEHPGPDRGAREAMVVRLPGCLVEAPLELPLELLALGVESIALRLEGCDAAEQHRAGRVERWGALLAMVDQAFAEPREGRAKRQVHDADAMPTLQRRTLFGLGRAPDAPSGDAWNPTSAPPINSGCARYSSSSGRARSRRRRNCRVLASCSLRRAAVPAGSACRSAPTTR